jgi:hypothetical protein
LVKIFGLTSSSYPRFPIMVVGWQGAHESNDSLKVTHPASTIPTLDNLRAINVFDMAYFLCVISEWTSQQSQGP